MVPRRPSQSSNSLADIFYQHCGRAWTQSLPRHQPSVVYNRCGLYALYLHELVHSHTSYIVTVPRGPCAYVQYTEYCRGRIKSSTVGNSIGAKAVVKRSPPSFHGVQRDCCYLCLRVLVHSLSSNISLWLQCTWRGFCSVDLVYCHCGRGCIEPREVRVFHDLTHAQTRSCIIFANGTFSNS